jgi:hypothetical protein
MYVKLSAAQQAPSHPVETPRQVPKLLDGADGNASKPSGGHSTIEIVLSIGVLAFGVILMGFEIWVIAKSRQYWDALSIKIVGLTLVVTAGMFLIVAGYSQDQAAPLMGLLGTVAGYLLGKERNQPAEPGPREGERNAQR